MGRLSTFTFGRLLNLLVSQCVGCCSIWTRLSVTSVACYTCRRACGRLDGYSAKGEVSHKFKKHGVEAAKGVGINKAEINMAARWAIQAMLCILNSIVPQLTSVLPCRHESETTDLYCIFDPDTAHRLAGWGWDWHENHQ